LKTFLVANLFDSNFCSQTREPTAGKYSGNKSSPPNHERKKKKEIKNGNLKNLLFIIAG
jgi:hypothetical protein